MMQVNEMQFGEAQPVEGYGPGFFRIAGKVLQGPILMTLGGVTGWGGIEDRAPLLALAGGGSIDVLLVGMGGEIAHLPADLRRAIEAAGIGAEVMNSPAACRTWNVLAAEGRRVALAALPV